MARIKRMLCWLGLGVGVLSGRKAWAQTGTSDRAVVYTVPTTGEARRFEVPQVRLANAAAARRINRALLRQFRGRIAGEIDSTVSPQQQLRQAARACCYDEEARYWRAGGDGVTGTSYGVLLNQHSLLSLAFQDEWQGLLQPSTHHLTFDLRTGRYLRVADVVADPPAELGRRLGWAISRRLQDELASVAASYGDSTTIARVAELYGIEEWNAAPKRAVVMGYSNDPDWPYFGDFALRPDALLLFYPVGMSRLDFEFLPDDTYTFPWTRLHPKSRLLPLLRSAPTVQPAPKQKLHH